MIPNPIYLTETETETLLNGQALSHIDGIKATRKILADLGLDSSLKNSKNIYEKYIGKDHVKLDESIPSLHLYPGVVEKMKKEEEEEKKELKRNLLIMEVSKEFPSVGRKLASKMLGSENITDPEFSVLHSNIDLLIAKNRLAGDLARLKIEELEREIQEAKALCESLHKKADLYYEFRAIIYEYGDNDQTPPTE